MTPRVFLSHSSLDKERFAVGFAERLRENGVDVWLDDWELVPGDSLELQGEGEDQLRGVVCVEHGTVMNQHALNRGERAALPLL